MLNVKFIPAMQNRIFKPAEMKFIVTENHCT